MKSKWESEKENLEQLILIEKLSYEEIGRRYGCTGNNIKKVALRLGINLPRRRAINECETFNKGVIRVPIIVCQNCGKEFKRLSSGANKFCCIECASEYKAKETIKKWKEGNYHIDANSSISDSIKEYLFTKANYKCEICGFSGVNKFTNKTILQIHHIDGDVSNNNEKNLQVVCPNCHAITDTFMALNKGKSSRSKRYNK